MNETILWAVIGISVTLATTAFALLFNRNRSIAWLILISAVLVCGVCCYNFYCKDIIIVEEPLNSDQGFATNEWVSLPPTQSTIAPTHTPDIDDSSTKQINVSPRTGIIAAGNDFTVALLSDGTVKCIGNNKEIHIEDWDCITQLSACGNHLLGLRQDQTVEFSGISNDGERNVSAWTNIVEVATSNKGSFGLTSRGRVRFTGYDINDLSACEKWTGIKRIYDGEDHFVALGSSGMLVASGSHGGGDGRRKISDLTDVISACAANGSTFAVFSGGTVQALGTGVYGEDNVSGWTNIVAVVGGDKHTVGLKNDGTVVAVGDNSYAQCEVGSWTDIVAICAGQYHTVGVKSDGTLVATGLNSSGQCNVEGIDLW